MKRKSGLIECLKEDLTPVKPQTDPVRWAAIWFLIAMVSVGLGLSAMPVRPDLAQKLSEFPFILYAAWLLVGALVVAVAISWISRPGRPGQKALIVAGFTTVTLAAMGLLGQTLNTIFHTGHGVSCDLSGARCMMGVLMLSVAPAVFFFLRIRKTAPIHPGLSGGMIGLASGIVASAALSFSCRDDEAFHLLSWHLLLPLLFLGLAGAWSGRKYLRW